MILNTELRVGNLVREKITGAFMRITDISETGYTSYVIDRSLFPLPEGWQAVPIPITEDLLLKAGFVQTYKSRWHTDYDADELGHGEIGVNFYHENNTIVFRFYGEHRTPLHFLHQLQNLYFALTGEELKINL